MLIIGILSISCIESVSAQSAVYVNATSTDDDFKIRGVGGYCNWDIDITGFDIANTDLTNHWDYASSTVTYQNIGDGTIKVRVKDNFLNHKFTYYDWGTIPINGDGIYVPKYGGGGRYVNVTGSPNVTGFIECVVNVRPAYFQFDTRHTAADLTIVVHNGEVIENASIILMNGARKVQWTDENGEAEFSPHTGKYVMIVEADGYDVMLVEDLTFEVDKSYRITINMTECISSCGSTFYAPSGDALIMYYREKEPNMGPISPQQFVNFFSDRLRTCMGSQDKNSDGTLERMMTRYGVAPDPPLNVLLYDCNFTKIECDQDGICAWNIEYIIKNYQQYNCNYTVNLICSDVITELGSGELMPTWSMNGKKTENVIVEIKGDCKQMHLAVLSEKVED